MSGEIATIFKQLEKESKYHLDCWLKKHKKDGHLLRPLHMQGTCVAYCVPCKEIALWEVIEDAKD